MVVVTTAALRLPPRWWLVQFGPAEVVAVRDELTLAEEAIRWEPAYIYPPPATCWGGGGLTPLGVFTEEESLAAAAHMG